MRASNNTLSWLGIVAVCLFTILAAGCAHMLPEYQARLDEFAAQIATLEDQKATIGADLVAAREAHREAMNTVAHQREIMLGMAPGPDRDAVAASVATLEEHAAALEDVIEVQKQAAEGLDQAATSVASASKAYKTESAGNVIGIVTGLVGSLLGLRANGIVQAAKSAPSRAQGAIDELYDRLGAIVAKVESYKGEASTLLALLEKGMVAPPLTLQPTTTPAQPAKPA